MTRKFQTTPNLELCFFFASTRRFILSKTFSISPPTRYCLYTSCVAPSTETINLSSPDFARPSTCSSVRLFRWALVIVRRPLSTALYLIISIKDLLSKGSPQLYKSTDCSHLPRLSMTGLNWSSFMRPRSTVLSPSPVGQSGHFRSQWLVGSSASFFGMDHSRDTPSL